MNFRGQFGDVMQREAEYNDAAQVEYARSGQRRGSGKAWNQRRRSLRGRLIRGVLTMPESSAAESSAAESSAGPARLPLFVEALGYLGAVIAIVAAAIALHQLLPNVPPGAELAFAGAVAVGLLVVGAVLRTDGEPAFGRLRSAAWLVSTISLAAFVGILADRFLHLGGVSVLLLAEAGWTIYAAPLWWRSRASLQHLAMFGGLAALVGTGIHRLDPHLLVWAPGLGVWILSALWGTAVYRGYLAPRTAGLVAASAGLLFGAQLALAVGTGALRLLALVTVAGLLAAGVVIRRVLLVGFGGVGAIVLVPQLASRYLPGSIGSPLAVAIVGLLLVVIAIWLATTRKTAASAPLTPRSGAS